MLTDGLWDEKLYREIIFYVLLFLLLVYGASVYLLKRNKKYTPVWASLKSWIFTAPILLAIAGLPSPWPLLCLILISIFGTKSYFMMTGMYHRSWFVWSTYLFILATGYTIYAGFNNLYNLLPMIFLAVIFMIPLLRNSAKHMIQYIALSMLAFLFWGWGFLHLGRILTMDKGIYILLYIIILGEFAEAISIGATKVFGRLKPFSNITSKVSIEGVCVSVFFTLLLAWAGRGLLPYSSEMYWLATGLTVAIFGRFGGLVVSVIRRDLGIKDSGVFIMGRDDILARIDKPIFVAPLVYYVLLYLQGQL